MGERALDILRDLGALPAVPFHECGPARYLETALQRLPVDVDRDAYGNIIAHYAKGAGADSRPIAFVAHMDHPGFETIETNGPGVVARALGGIPAASLTNPTPVLVLPDAGEPIPAETRPFEGPAPEGSGDRLVTIQLRQPARIPPSTPVVFDLPGFELDGGTIRMRALDDLAGCAAILASVERLVEDEADTDMYAVFTRAEEVGLFGARLAALEETLPRDAVVVSVESSPIIPGVAQGDGPVVRTGDARTTFDDRAEQVLRGAAARLKERGGSFRSQRQLMSGGVCEATAFAAAGYSVTGIAFPLGSYHNATTRITDPESGIAAEFIELSDFLGGVDLIAEAARGAEAGGGPLPSSRALPHVPDEVRNRLQATSQAVTFHHSLWVPACAGTTGSA